MPRTVKPGDSYEDGEDVELEQAEPVPEPSEFDQSHSHASIDADAEGVIDPDPGDDRGSLR